MASPSEPTRPDDPSVAAAAPTTVAALLAAATARLRAAGSETARLDAELLLGHAVGVDRTVLLAHPEAPVGFDARARLDADLVRREAGEPVAYIRGFKEFFGLAFSTDARALIPRPETEALVELAEAEIVRRLTSTARPRGTERLRVADLGTGGGTIAVTLAVLLRRRGMSREVEFLATDVSPEALQLARENAVGHGVADGMRFIEADLLPPVCPTLDVILANLPYVASDEVDRLPIAASFEPRIALDGGADGLSVVESLLERSAGVVAADGVLLLEIGSTQASGVRDLAEARLPGWTVTVHRDLAGLPRVARLDPPGIAPPGIAPAGAGRGR